MFAAKVTTPSSSRNLGRVLFHPDSVSFLGYTNIPESIKKEKVFERVCNLPELRITWKGGVFKGLPLERGEQDFVELNSCYWFDFALVKMSGASFGFPIFEEFLNFEFQRGFSLHFWGLSIFPPFLKDFTHFPSFLKSSLFPFPNGGGSLSPFLW